MTQPSLRSTQRVGLPNLPLTITLFCLWMLMVNVAARVPDLTIALCIIGAYGCLALLILRLLPELGRLLHRNDWKVVAAIAGTSLFAMITPAHAAIFDTAERYTMQIFGQYIDPAMITLIFGFLRISAFIIGAAFIMLALEKARHGENWQPFAWNAFAVLMIVVLVEGMSALFLSTTGAGGRP